MNLLQGLQSAEELIPNTHTKKIFVRDVDLMIKWVKEDNLNELYEFFTLT